MDILQFFAELITSVFKHGLSLTTLAVAVTALLRVQGIRKILTKRLPRRFRHEDRLERIERKVDALMGAGGITWDVPYLNGRIKHKETDGQKSSLLKRLAAYVRAPSIGASILLIKDSYHSKTKGENTPMTKDILSGKKKFIAFIIAVLINGLNDVLGLNLSVSTLDAATYIGGGLIAVEGLLDIVRALSKKKMLEVAPYDAKALNIVRQDSEGA